ncbi:MAG: glutathione synthase, partial [Sinobacterium sp.]|nr:glutathione synthase [Sinobacterium sp.]
MTRLAIVMDPIESINYKKDSSLAMLWAAKKKGWSLFYIQPSNLFIDDGEAKCICQALDVFEDPNHFYQLDSEQTVDLASMNVILMRKDPPFDNEFIYNTYILELAETKGALVVNKPQSLRDCNEKVFATHFPQCCPPVRVTASPALLKDFHQTHGDVIFKPLDGMGGSKIFRLKPNDPNVSVIIETLTDFGKISIMAQKFIPEISEGDKRILLINGKPIPYGLARIP